jgi:two-component system sensor histidine kinase TctE
MTETDNKKRDELLSQLKVSVDRTANLTKKLLSASHATSLSKRSDSFGLCNLVHVANEVILNYFREAQALNIDLGYEGPESLVSVWGEEGALYEMVSNLVENALRYSSAGCQVTVRIETKPNVVLSVIDNGRGIAPEDKPLVFERFYRVLGTKVEGSGLGLAIVKEVADAFGATVKISDGPSGSGSCFSVSFKNAAPYKESASYISREALSRAALQK